MRHRDTRPRASQVHSCKRVGLWKADPQQGRSAASPLRFEQDGRQSSCDWSRLSKLIRRLGADRDRVHKSSIHIM